MWRQAAGAPSFPWLWKGGSPLRTHSNSGAIIFLAATAVGAFLLLTGLADTAPERTGVRMPQRNTAAFAYRAPLCCARTVPEQGGLGTEAEIETLSERIQGFLAAADATANSALDQDHLFIQLYGGVQALSDRTVIEDVDPRYSVVKLADGTLTFVNSQPQDVTGHGRAVARLSLALEERDIPLLYVQAPQKLQPQDSRLPAGVNDYGDHYADQVLSVLKEQGVATLDLREAFIATGREWSSFFFRTDHHWTPEAAFLANQVLSARLEEKYGWDFPHQNTDPDSFQRVTLSDWFLGSQGKRVGSLYGGVDDIEIWIPQFETDFTYLVPIYDMERTGPFEESLLFPERVEELDWFGGNPYTLYSGGDYPMGRIYNHTNEQGPRILLLRDSYACVLTPFLALNCSELITIDLRYFGDDLLAYVDWLEPDLVLVIYTAGSTAIEELFSFFSDTPQVFYEASPPMVEKPPLGGE